MSNSLIEKKGSYSKFFTEGKIYYLGTYHKYWLDKGRRIRNPSFDRFSSKILDLKRGKKAAVEYFYNILKDIIPDDENLMICVVPSSNPRAYNEGIKKVAKILARRKSFIDGTFVLKRTKKIQKLTSGGDRSMQVHYDSIKVVWKGSHVAEELSPLILEKGVVIGVKRYCYNWNLLKLWGRLLFSLNTGRKPIIERQKRIILLDDVTTSGNSLRACREILKKNGAGEVYMLALGRTAKETSVCC